MTKIINLNSLSNIIITLNKRETNRRGMKNCLLNNYKIHHILIQTNLYKIYIKMINVIAVIEAIGVLKIVSMRKLIDLYKDARLVSLIQLKRKT